MLFRNDNNLLKFAKNNRKYVSKQNMQTVFYLHIKNFIFSSFINQYTLLNQTMWQS